MNIRGPQFPSRWFQDSAQRWKYFLQIVVAVAVSAVVLTVESGCTAAAKRDRRLKQADRYFSEQRYDEAEIEYKNVLTIEPLNPAAIGRLGLIYFEQGRQGRAMAYLIKGAELQPENLDVKLKLAFAQYGGGRLTEARDAVLLVLAKRPADPEAPLLLAEASMQPPQMEDARSRLQQLPASAAESAPVLVALAVLDLRQRKVDAGEAGLKRALARDPKLSAVHSVLGNFYLSQKDLKQAEPELKMAAELSPIRSAARLQFARFKILNKDVAAGRQILEEITQKAPDYIPAWMALAQAAASENKFDEASGYIAKILAREGADFEALLMNGRLLLAKGENDKSAAEMERMLTLFPQAPQVHYQLAQALVASGNLTKALSSVNQAVTLAQNYADAVTLQASLNIRQGNNGPAQVALKRIIQQHPDLIPPRMLLADTYRNQNNLADALAVYQQIEQTSPRLPQVSYLSGLVYLRQKKNSEARQAFERTVTLAPTFYPAVERLAYLDILEKHPEEARKRVEIFSAKTPKSAEPYVLLARVMMEQKDSQMAEIALRKAIAVQPAAPTAYHLLARIQLEKNEPEKALKNLQDILANAPSDAEALMLLSSIYEQQKNYRAAADAYEKLIAQNPKFGAGYNNLAFLYLEHLDQIDKAYEMARKAKELLPSDPNVADTLGWTLFRKKQYGPALTILEESAEKLTSSAEVKYHVGMAQYMMGNETAARESLQNALELGTEFAGRDDAKLRLTVLDINPEKAGTDALATLEKLVSDHKDDPVALVRLAAVYEQRGVTDKAIATNETALAANPKNLPVNINLIRLYSTRSDTAKALEFAKGVRKLAPEDPDVAYALGRLACQTGQHSWGLGLLQEAARKQPNAPEILYDVAEASFAVGKTSDAEAAMRQAVESTQPFTRMEKGRRFLELLAIAGEPERANASTLIDSVLKSTPNDGPALMASAAIQEFKRDSGAARKTYEKVLGFYPDLAPAKRRLTILFAQSSDADPKKSLELATKAREAYPSDPEVAKAFGIILYRQGNFTRASALLTESAATRADDPDVMFYLGMARYKLQDRVGSKKALQNSLALKLGADLAAEARRTLADIK